jgi:hypothetical protein
MESGESEVGSGGRFFSTPYSPLATFHSHIASTALIIIGFTQYGQGMPFSPTHSLRFRLNNPPRLPKRDYCELSYNDHLRHKTAAYD